MMKLSQRWRWAMGCLETVPLADKCLILIMVILLAQSGYSLFSLNFQEGNMIDVVIRTTSSAIFGYFISANFLAGGGPACQFPPPPPAPGAGRPAVPRDGDAPRAEIGFHPDSEGGKLRSGYVRLRSEAPPERENRFQVLVVALVGVAALLLLIVARNFLADDGPAAATLSQLRDFVSGSVGFLLGHTTHRPSSGVLP
ncbi:MAG: hypothetical protein RR288_04500 [Oscillibacter sp.]